MAAPEVWVAKDDGSELVRAEVIMAVGRDYTGTVTIRLCDAAGWPDSGQLTVGPGAMQI